MAISWIHVFMNRKYVTSPACKFHEYRHMSEFTYQSLHICFCFNSSVYHIVRAQKLIAEQVLNLYSPCYIICNAMSLGKELPMRQESSRNEPNLAIVRSPSLVFTNIWMVFCHLELREV